jgi:nucleotide-binding universal stress UspA family protein
MFQRILVPLDGSPRAEEAIPVAAGLARASSGSIVLLRVVTAAINFAWSALESPLMMQGPLDAEHARATEYLARIAESKDLTGIGIETVVLSGEPASVIFSVAHSHKADLIVMCSHGYTGLKRWALGSVTHKVARHSPVPVLVLREGAGVPTNLHPEGMRPVRVLVALDGSSLSEIALAPAAQLSAALSAPAQGELHLVQVIHFPELEGDGQYGVVSETRKLAVSAAQAYLTTIKEQLHEGDLAKLNLQITSSVMANTDVADTLIGMAELGEGMEVQQGFNGRDVMAMATHGRGGLERWMVGSVTERVLGATKLPLLIVRPRKTEAKVGEVGVGTASEVTETSAASIQSWVGLF